MIQLFHNLSNACSKATTLGYSTSFSSAIRLLHEDLRKPVYNIYGFVRFADEIVDSFHGYDKQTLLSEFKSDTYKSLQRGISINPILNSFQQTVNEFKINHELIEAFFKSMERDLDQKSYDKEGYKEYIYGSAEVVGLMCLHVFCNGNINNYELLKPYARALGAAFQKVNFLRDVKADFNTLERTYFPGVDLTNFTSEKKQLIEREIQNDFDMARKGIEMLPTKARFGVYVAYKYYLSLFNKIKRVRPAFILKDRVRIPNYLKAYIVLDAGLKSQLKLI